MERTKQRDRKLADYIYDDLGPDDMLKIEREISEDPEFSDKFRLNMKVKDYLKAKIQLEEMREDPQLSIAEELAEREARIYSGNPVPDVEIPEDLLVPGIDDLPVKGIEDISDSADENPPVSERKFRPSVLTIAASLALLIAVGVYSINTSPDRLYNQHYEPLEATDFTQRGEINEGYQVVAEGISSYLAGDYQQSLTIFDKLNTDPIFQEESQFYSGLSHMGIGSYEDAQHVLESAYDGATRYQPEIMWYLSLCYLKTGEFTKARKLLKELQSYSGLYKANAQSLVKKLGRIR